MGGKMSNTTSNTVPENFKKLEELYERLEKEPDLEKQFLEDKNKFLIDHGFEPDEVEIMLKELHKNRLKELSSVLKEHEGKLK